MEIVMTTTVSRPVAIKIDEATRARVKRLADARHRTPHWLMREAITQYVEREEMREALRQDTLKAWDEYRATGLHATAEDVEAWLASWGTDNELPAP
ncbi:MAG: CopG family ribbon-helix-helix protein, partial [Proteobacteria bacterium]|nr:CopG family ribbon-helix-helix protein [Pseudomonadota bacterium]